MKRLCAIVLILLSLLSAQSDIDKRIERIRNAPIEERYKLMNALKRELIRMREEERLRIIKKLKHTSKTKRNTSSATHGKRHDAPEAQKRNKDNFAKRRTVEEHIHEIRDDIHERGEIHENFEKEEIDDD